MAKTCGAKTRSGARCKTSPMKNGRCRLHGGMSSGPPKGSANAATHGIYQKHLTDDEQDQYEAIELGAVDHELRLTRIRLARALAAENKADGQPELEEITENDGGGEGVPYETRKRKVRDYASIIDKLTARIESLERTRKHLDSAESSTHEIIGFEAIPYDEQAADSTDAHQRASS